MSRFAFLRILLVSTLTSALLSCGPSKSEIKNEFSKSCIEESKRQTTDTFILRIAHEYCECAGEKAADKFTQKEWQELEKMKKDGRVAEMQEKVMPVIQPCEEEMRKKMMEAPVGQ